MRLKMIGFGFWWGCNIEEGFRNIASKFFFNGGWERNFFIGVCFLREEGYGDCIFFSF